MAGQARGDANRLYYQERRAPAGWPSPRLMRWAVRHGIDAQAAGEGNYLAQAQLLAGMPQFQNASHGPARDTSPATAAV